MNCFKKNESTILDNINGHSLDKYQRKIVLDDSDSLLVVAGAGSGKTLTMIGKIKYLVEIKKIDIRDILCISFTNETVNSLKNKLNYDVDVYTFHKLALSILRDFRIDFHITTEYTLYYLVEEYFESQIFIDNYSNFIMEYFNNSSYYEIIKSKEFIYFKRTIISFIKKIKSNNHKTKDFNRYLELNIKSSTKDKNKILLIFIFRILYLYTEELNSMNLIDFDDMIIKAICCVNRYGIKRRYKYIIIDEFQDTSFVRYDLIKAIINKIHSKIICVGDDFQSIYSFSGCNLDLFVNFQDYFQNAKKMFIKNTYRNSYEVINISSSFIMKNSYQIKKELKAKFLLKDPIKLIYYDELNYKEQFYKLLDYLIKINKKKIMILGRYNKDINILFDSKDLSYRDMELRYLTVHKSKGLEEEDIIIINMENSYMGFPSKIKDNPIFDLLKSSKENYPYAEERRLFYVALTRTKHNVYILVNKNNPSIFIKEIKNYTVDLFV